METPQPPLPRPSLPDDLTDTERVRHGELVGELREHEGWEVFWRYVAQVAYGHYVTLRDFRQDADSQYHRGALDFKDVLAGLPQRIVDEGRAVMQARETPERQEPAAFARRGDGPSAV